MKNGTTAFYIPVSSRDALIREQPAGLSPWVEAEITLPVALVDFLDRRGFLLTNFLLIGGDSFHLPHDPKGSVMCRRLLKLTREWHPFQETARYVIGQLARRTAEDLLAISSALCISVSEAAFGLVRMYCPESDNWIRQDTGEYFPVGRAENIIPGPWAPRIPGKKGRGSAKRPPRRKAEAI